MPAARYQHLDDPFWTSLLALCAEAGARICEHYNEPSLAGKLRAKADDSPLTRADLASHTILSRGLAALEPALPVLSEESDRSEIAGRRQWERFWMVDPLDGTREFLERTGEFTINVALIDAQRAVAGVIYQPLERRAYFGALGAGARCCSWRGGDRHGKAIHTSPLTASTLIMLASRRHRNARLQRTLEFLGASREIERRDSSSALKFCELAAGRGDCYPRFSPCSEWDVAAGDALVTAAGGAVLGMDGKPLRYNRRETLLAEPFLAVGDPTASLWGDLLAQLNSADQTP
jgi:3'(2'), 5'-bisphosphate nucleotidase